MSERPLKMHTHASNRAKPHEHPDRKVVFKSALDSPFHIKWPSVPLNIQNMCIARVLQLLRGVSDYQAAKDRDIRKRKRSRDKERAEPKSKKSQLILAEKRRVSQAPDAETAVEDDSPDVSPTHSPITDTPTILSHLTLGINQVTKRLESCMKRHCTARVTTCSDDPAAAAAPSYQSPLAVILVCRADINPPLLIAHLPHLVAAYNTSIISHPFSSGLPLIKLLPLPKGSELQLAEACGLRRVAILAFDGETPELESLYSLVESIPPLTAHWLAPATIRRTKTLIPTHIKQIRTSAPKDMKAAKEKRAASRTAAKQRRKIAKEEALALRKLLPVERMKEEHGDAKE